MLFCCELRALGGGGSQKVMNDDEGEGGHDSTQNWWPDGEATAHLWQRLGVLLQRGNANLFNNRIPNHPEPQVDGLL